MKNSLQAFCKETGMEYLLDQWDHEKNKDLTPMLIARGSHAKVWWRCEKGHQWQAEVKSRVEGCNCPVCTNRKLISGENDLETLYPELAKQWHKEKNGQLTSEQVFAGSRKRVWWRCEKGHEWQANIWSRTSNGNGCPVCAGKVIIPGVNDLASAFPSVAEQWHPTKNGELKPDGISPYSNRKVWWQCEKGHEWQSSVSHRTSMGSGCPYCAGRKVLAGFNDLETKFPKVAAQWHPTLNGELTPQMVTSGSHKKVWWECDLGHVWKTAIYSRTMPRGTGCPVCAGKVKENR